MIGSKSNIAVGKIKEKVKNSHICPECHQKIDLGIEREILNLLNNDKKYPYPHIHIHGDPLHAMLCYIDKDLRVRGMSVVKSIEISRDSTSFKEFFKKWSNPY
ncbi:MAG: hypothetical protein BAJALOKI2v1_540009 [Promethearchaeota archaeon]|nr:MAG: hypothetical protein BAJALOKI2v1_540009 [Candidatus Lokiarchaeota archaeon]